MQPVKMIHTFSKAIPSLKFNILSFINQTCLSSTKCKLNYFLSKFPPSCVCKRNNNNDNMAVGKFRQTKLFANCLITFGKGNKIQTVTKSKELECLRNFRDRI